MIEEDLTAGKDAVLALKIEGGQGALEEGGQGAEIEGNHAQEAGTEEGFYFYMC